MNFQFYYYAPSGAAAGIFVALFGLTSALHSYQLVCTRTWFMIPFTIGCILETIGYIGRVLSSTETPNWTMGPYVMQSALILIAPAFLAASIYMTLGRIISMLNAEKCSIVPLRFLTKIFVAGDVLSFLMQASGSGLMVSNSNNPSTGEHVIIGGLFVQIIFFAIFVVTAVIFQNRLAHTRIGASTGLVPVAQRHLMALYVVSVLILIRSVIRAVEYIMGYDSFLMNHEAFIYVFDALLMFFAVVTLHWAHPSEVNCFLGRGNKYCKDMIKMQDFVPGERPKVSTHSSA